LKRVINIIDEHDTKKPLFLYWAPHNLHQPLEVPQNILDQFSFIDNPYRQLYSAMAFYIDSAIGKVVQELKNKKLYDNTLIVVASDNGGPVYFRGTAGANNYPLKGGKVYLWEGGVRVNALASGGLIPKSVHGTKVEGLIGIEDWYTTFCGLAGVDSFDKSAAEVGLPPVDGIDVWPLISGKNLTGPRTEILLGTQTFQNTTVGGIISGRYKLITGLQEMSGWQGPFFPNSTFWEAELALQNCGNGCLFDIYADPTEHFDLAKSNPTTAAELLAKIQEAQKTVFDPYRGQADPRACEAVRGKNKGFWGPFL